MTGAALVFLSEHTAGEIARCWPQVPKRQPRCISGQPCDDLTLTVVAHFADICCGEVRCYDLPSFHAINRVLMQILDGGPMHSLRLDAQGKTLGVALPLKPLNNHTESTEKQRQAI